MKRMFLVLLVLVFIYPIISSGAEKDSISLNLIWEKGFNSHVKDFSFTDEKGVPTLQTIITNDEVIFGEGKNAKRIMTKSGWLKKDEGWFYTTFKSSDDKYIGIRKECHGENGMMLDGEFTILNNSGIELKIVNYISHAEKPLFLLNNGNYIVNIASRGWSHLGILDRNTGKIIKEVYPINDFWSSGYLDIAEKVGLFTICVTGTEEQKESIVILYDSIGNEIWKRKLEKGWTGHIAISPYGKYIAAVGKSVRWLYEFNSKGELLWKLRTSVVDVMKYSEDEEHLILCGPPNTIKFILSKTSDIKWEYKLPEGRDYYAVDISSNNSYVIGIDGGGGREVPSGDINIVYLFDNNGNLLWQKSYKGINWKMPEVSFSQDSKYFIMAISKKIYCYEIKGAK